MISQISTNYGIDIYGKPALTNLLRALGTVDIPWIRVHYAYPTGLTPDVLTAYREVPNVLPYLDLPLQHSHPDVLKAMNRPWQLDVNVALLDQIRDQLPDAVLRTTLIVGFPGETQGHFDHLASFVENQCFDHVGVFTFSVEEGTKAATLSDQVPHEVAIARKDQLMTIQQPIAEAKNRSWVGRKVDVLVDECTPHTGEIIGRCARFAPQVDGEVFLNAALDNFNVEVGTMLPALITGVDLYDLTAELVEPST